MPPSSTWSLRTRRLPPRHRIADLDRAWRAGDAARADLRDNRIDVTASYLTGALPFLWTLLVGIAFVVVIVLLPEGLAPIVGRCCGARGRPSDWPACRCKRATPSGRSSHAFAFTEIEPCPCAPKGLQKALGKPQGDRRLSLEARASRNPFDRRTEWCRQDHIMRCVSDGGERSGGKVFVNGVEIGRGAPRASPRWASDAASRTPTCSIR